jgi:hypothetical protein
MPAKKDSSPTSTGVMVAMFKCIDDLPGRRLVDVIAASDADENDHETVGKCLRDSFLPGLEKILPGIPTPHRAMLEVAIDETDWTYLAKEIIAHGHEQKND